MSLGTLACSHSHLAAERSWVKQRPGNLTLGERFMLSHEPAHAHWASDPPLLCKAALMVYSTQVEDSQAALAASSTVWESAIRVLYTMGAGL